MSPRRGPSEETQTRSQLDLFAADPVHAAPQKPRRGKRAVGPADVPDEVRTLARNLPATLHMGTSSWSFPGWAGLVYDDVYPAQRLARDGLAAYARHPLLRAVGVDRTHYAPVAADVLAAYAAAVPDEFRFLVKAHEMCTLARFPGHDRYGRYRNQPNDRFLDPAYAAEVVVAPFMTGLGAKGGPLLFQLAPQPMELLGGSPGKFAERLHAFLAALPRGPLYTVEVRNAALLTRAYAEALASAGACHCVNIIRGMPDPIAQWQMTGGSAAPALVIRWMLQPHLTYEQAKDRYEPFDAIRDPDPRARQAIATLVRRAQDLGRPAYVIVNNKAEGSSPLSVLHLAEELALHDDVPF